jgi:polyribonucleotide nucleotidyltransferase
MEQYVETSVFGQTLKISTGKLAKQAGGSVLVQMGDTIVFAAATMAKQPKAGLDFFPLTCDYEERKYAVGKIPGGFIKRGGRPGEKATLVSRLIDRPLRPLFPKGMRNETQVIAMPLSMQPEFPPDVLAVNAASAALVVSNIPFKGPIGCVRVALGEEEGTFILNPSLEVQATNALDLVLAGTKDSIAMVEAGASEVTEEVMLAAFEFGMEAIKVLVAIQEELAAKLGVVKVEVPLHKENAEILAIVHERYDAILRAGLQEPDKASREAGLTLLIDEVVDGLKGEFPDQIGDIREAADKAVKDQLRDLILKEGKRPDGRSTTEIRPITVEAGLLPRVHGTGLFTRGQTQVLTTLTLGSGEDAQKMDTLEEDGEKNYMHFYNFPPYSVGEARPMRGPGRREIGHGALAERALRAVVPTKADFPYTMLLTSEVLESNGSTSMASTCGSTIALMDAGVPIKAPVAGIAMGLIEGPKPEDGSERQYAVLTDIQGMEDFSGDMDFKVAGTRDGITALQLDTKIGGVPHHVFVQAFQQAKDARFHILDKIVEVISAPRDSMSDYAPRIITLHIDPEQIGTVIGPGGKTIKKITAETGAKIDIQQDGTVFIAAVDGLAGEAARKMVEDLTRTLKPGEIYEGTVVRFLQFGAFVEIVPGKDGLVHVSQLSDSDERVAKPEDVVKLGDKLRVRITEIDPQGRVNLTARGLDDAFDPANPEPGRPPRGERPDRGGDRGGRGGDRGGDRGGRGGDRGGRGGFGGDRGGRGGDRPSNGGSFSEPLDTPDIPAPIEAREDDDLPRARFRPQR